MLWLSLLLLLLGMLALSFEGRVDAPRALMDGWGELAMEKLFEWMIPRHGMDL